ncbi:CAP domain-containing protein [Sutcliffiella cohnii]|uniref:CAP domain-containing protein n=1 Tax=Sutcliffiella cohnii TaxID=33932 RepID=UPI002E24B16C|nr:CAP domain-containing protein [Sutcliffiella cohnii]
MLKSKRTLLSFITALTFIVAFSFGTIASADSGSNTYVKNHFIKQVTVFKSQEDIQTFFEKFMAELESKLQKSNSVEEKAPTSKEEVPTKEQNEPIEKEPAKTESKEPEKEQQPKEPVQTTPPSKSVEEEKRQETNTDQSIGVSAFEQKVVQLTNEERAKQGLAPLQLDKNLSKVAREKSKDMQTQNYFSHTSPTYGSPFEMMNQFGISYKSAGENIAMGQRSPEEVVNAWMNSPGHRANIMNSSFTHIGVGHVEQGNYWTQMFIGK